MLEKCETAQERWGGVHQLVDHWLIQRRSLLVSFKALNDACDANMETPIKPYIDEFSQLLMDYVSSGHFTVYLQLAKEAEAFGDTQALALASRLLERLDMSTELVLAFDEDYDTPASCERNLNRLPAWIERLTKGLSERFELEDELIARLHDTHTPSAE
ncbi:sigma D regulator [Halomonas halocynthiae]|uniref:sigma D regulator n=1 Tax=Halomonas halocynthiae TaxID=176290 RepID=UPI00042942F5|nr:sigma D regulator [Halomonas halocynthiae]